MEVSGRIDRVAQQQAVLHVCSDFAKQRIYTHLVASLDRLGVRQEVYAAVRSRRETEWSPPELSTVVCHCRQVLARRHRILFRSKIRCVTRDLTACVNLGRVRVVHAHFLYSDGAVALALNESHRLPYVVSVRNTDLNFFMKYRPDLIAVRDLVLERASRVVFLSDAYRRVLDGHLRRTVRQQVARKSVVIPNGLTAEWLEVPKRGVMDPPGALRLLYVGDFSRNKNLPAVLQAAGRLSLTRPVELSLVGGGGDGEAQLRNLIASGRYPFATLHPRIEDPSTLRAMYRRHDVFVMPSRFETFGVVYIEALSQGLPVVHSRGQGVDGYFEPGTVAEAVDPDNPTDISAKIAALAGRLPAIRENCVRQAARFDWCQVAREYKGLYDAVDAEASAQ